MFENEEKKGLGRRKKTKPEIKKRHQQFVTGKACRGMLNRMNMEKQAAREERFEDKKKETRNSSLFPHKARAQHFIPPTFRSYSAFIPAKSPVKRERERERDAEEKQKISHVPTPRAT